MTPEQKEGNKLIAEFDPLMEGFDPSDPKKESWVRDGGIWIHKNDLKYHTSWDWLMPVIQKIESLDFTVSIFKGCCDIESNKNSDFETIQNGGGQPKIYSAWVSVTQFIKWYKTQQP